MLGKHYKAMTFQELNEKLGGGEIEADWAQHANGCGWVKKTAIVAASAFVGESAHVYGDARVYGNAHVYGDARVSGDALVSGNAHVYGDARVSGDALVSGNAHVYGDAWGKSPIYIQGSRHCVFQPKHGHIQIGCQCHPFAWWSTDAALEMAKNHGFTDAEIAEYREIVALIVKIGV